MSRLRVDSAILVAIVGRENERENEESLANLALHASTKFCLVRRASDGSDSQLLGAQVWIELGRRRRAKTSESPIQPDVDNA